MNTNSYTPTNLQPLTILHLLGIIIVPVLRLENISSSIYTKLAKIYGKRWEME